MTIERIEVLANAASGIYGGSATGGVVNMIGSTNELIRASLEPREIREILVHGNVVREDSIFAVLEKPVPDPPRRDKDVIGPFASTNFLHCAGFRFYGFGWNTS